MYERARGKTQRFFNICCHISSYMRNYERKKRIGNTRWRWRSFPPRSDWLGFVERVLSFHRLPNYSWIQLFHFTFQRFRIICHQLLCFEYADRWIYGNVWKLETNGENFIESEKDEDRGWEGPKGKTAERGRERERAATAGNQPKTLIQLVCNWFVTNSDSK